MRDYSYYVGPTYDPRVAHVFEVAVCVGKAIPGTPTTDPDDWFYENKIIKATARMGAFGTSNPCIGAVVASTCELQLYTGTVERLQDLISEFLPDVIETNVPIWFAWRLKNCVGYGEYWSSWCIDGPWFSDSWSYDPLTGTMRITGIDNLGLGDSDYLSIIWRTCFASDSVTSEQMSAVVDDIADILGVEITARAASLISANNCAVPRPDEGATVREVLRWCAGICGCNARIAFRYNPQPGTTSVTARGMLDFLPFNMCGETTDLYNAFANIRFGAPSDSNIYWDVLMDNTSTDTSYSSAKDEHTIVTTRFEMENPLCTSDAQCDTVLASLRAPRTDGLPDFVYTPATITDALLDPRAEPGDIINVAIPKYDGSTYSAQVYIGEIQRTYDASMKATITAPDMGRREIDRWTVEEWQQ